jgi:type III secretory pathway component EscR
MKKIFILLSLFLLTSCGLYKKIPVYEKSYYGYEQKELAINDAYWWADAYNAGAVPMEDWLTYQSYVKEGYQIERVFQKVWDDKTELTIIYTTCICDSISYHLLVQYRTKNKSLWIQ